MLHLHTILAGTLICFVAFGGISTSLLAIASVRFFSRTSLILFANTLQEVGGFGGCFFAVFKGEDFSSK